MRNKQEMQQQNKKPFEAEEISEIIKEDKQAVKMKGKPFYDQNSIVEIQKLLSELNLKSKNNQKAREHLDRK